MANLEQVKVGIINLTVGHWDLMVPRMQAIYATYPYPKEFFIIPNQQFELSLSAAMNKGFRRALAECDYVMYIADDVVPAHGDMINMMNKLIDEDLWVVYAWPGYEGSMTGGYCFFAAAPEVFLKVGYWDEEFYPAYFEDNDWDYRIKLKDESKIGRVDVMGTHQSSVTIDRMAHSKQSEFSAKFAAMRDRYERKWGGPPHHEVYTVPFNLPNDYSDYPGF